MSLENLNETTKNLLQALNEFKPAPVKPVDIKLLYDEKTGMVYSFTGGETDKPYVSITVEQYKANYHLKNLRVVNGKLEEVSRIRLKQLPLVEGNKWFTHKDNMLVIGKDNGWDERRYS